MSKNTNEDTLPQSPANTGGDTPPPRKRAPRKAAIPAADETATEPVAKKTSPRKTAVKKVAAKRAARKSAAASALGVTQAVLPVHPPPLPPESQAPQSEDSPRRFGRVPGGGPIVTREPAESRPPPPPASIPFPLPPQPPNRENQPQSGPPRDPQNRDGATQPAESRSKRRREKRKRRKGERHEQQSGQGSHGHQNQPSRHRHEGNGPHGNGNLNDYDERRPVQLSGPQIEADGMLELAPKGFGFLRVQKKNFEQARDDVFVTPETIRKYNLRLGQWIHGVYQEGPRGPQLVEITKVNDMTPEDASKLPHFDELKAINPTRRISFETTPDRYTTRVVDIMAPVGRGQRGLIVSPPRSGKTTLLLHMAEAIREKYDEGAIHLMVVLVDERPEEVTEFRRALPGAEIYASSNDEQARNHTRIAEFAIERAKRLVEAGKDVFLIMDSITRLARAYNGNMNNRGRGTASGGLTIGALEVPRRLFAAARNTRAEAL